MSSVKLGKSVPFDFTTHDPTTGNVIDADKLPTAKVFEEDGMTAMYTPTVVKRGEETGLYMVKIEATTANGFELGKNYNVIIEATVSSITTKAWIARLVIELQSLSDVETYKVGQKMEYVLKQSCKGSSEKVLELRKIK